MKLGDSINIGSHRDAEVQGRPVTHLRQAGECGDAGGEEITSALSQLPWQYRLWHMWCEHGPKRSGGGTLGGNSAFLAARHFSRLAPSGENNLFPVRFSSGLTVYVDLVDFETHQHTIKHFSRDDDVLTLVRKILRPGDVFVDVGANAGAYALPAARCVGPTGIVLAIEPQPRLATALRKSEEANNFRQLYVFDGALSDFVGTSDFFLSAMGSGTGSLSREYTWSSSVGVSVTVQVTMLDMLLASHKIDSVRLIKLDVEGSELAVLRGAHGTLSAHKPFVLFEANRVATSEADFRAVFENLQLTGYQRFLSTYDLAEQTADSIGQLTNIIALPAGQTLL